MITARLSVDNSPEVWWESDPTVRVRADFPLSASKGSENTAAVYVELEPGCKLGRHTDSAEEVLVILEGSVEVEVGSERGQVSAGEMALVPSMVPHSVRNIGPDRAAFVGVFSSGHVVATFDAPFSPNDQRVFEF